ncbi:MAG: hypothetical protein H7255_14865, partial [Ramlibacter sp.]|nr:hypothetical protein [Ramlibacter sp.]
MANSSIAQMLQEVYVLATGRSANAATQAQLEALVVQGNGAGLVAQEIDFAMGQLAAANGLVATFKTVVLNGFGVSLSDADVVALTPSLVALGIDSWSELFAFCINLQDNNGVVLDHRAEAGLAFNTTLASLGRTSLFTGATVDAAVANLLQNIGASAISVTNGQTGLDTLAAKLTAAGIESAVADGYVVGANVFVDANGDGIQKAGEFVTTPDASGHFLLPLTGPAGTPVASGGTDLLTDVAFKGALMAPAGAT